ncbi:MAG: hypothetical protein ACFFAH_03650 [Promethearchaeota archaeon]
MFLQSDKPSPNNPTDNILTGLEKWCEAFNRFAVAFFWYMKYIFAFILFAIGIFTLMKLRGIYIIERTKLAKKDIKGDNLLKNPRLILGISYITMALGFIFNFLIYFLIFCLDTLPDRFIFDFITFSGTIDPKSIDSIEDLNRAEYPHEKTIYFCVAIVSFIAILDLVISVAYIVNSSGKNHRKTLTQMMGGVILGILAGWTTCLPLFL